jgi:two-component system, NtrC family, response regulator HydG
VLKGINILVVDDDIGFSDSLKDILDSEGCRVDTARDGGEAIEKVKSASYDVVLMDIKMPVMNGVEAFKRIKSMGAKTRVIMMTAFSAEDLIRDALDHGAFGVMYKPLDIKKLISMIKEASVSGGLIMIADDDIKTKDELKHVFEEKNYKVSLAESLDEALKIARENPLDVIFLSTHLPPLNGLETYMAIRELNPAAVVVLMANVRDDVEELVEQALENSAYTCLYKPFDPRKALGIVEEIFKRKEK